LDAVSTVANYIGNSLICMFFSLRLYVSALILLVRQQERHLTCQKKWSSSLLKLNISVLEQLLEGWSNLDPEQQSVKQKHDADKPAQRI